MPTRKVFIATLFFVGVLHARDTAPIPDPQVLRQRAIANADKMRKDRENYSCSTRLQVFDLRSDGSVRQTKTNVAERFYVNGMPIEHVLERDGKVLSGDEAKKEQERTDKEVRKYSDAKKAQKQAAEFDRQMSSFVRAMKFSNGHRETREGATLVVYDLAGDPSYRPQSIEERFAQVTVGRIWLEESSGVPFEMKLETVRDLKIAGGLAANLHKGFQLHLIQQRLPDGVWMPKLVEGSGDARALILRQRVRFREESDKCHQFSVNTQQKVRPPK